MASSVVEKKKKIFSLWVKCGFVFPGHPFLSLIYVVHCSVAPFFSHTSHWCIKQPCLNASFNPLSLAAASIKSSIFQGWFQPSVRMQFLRSFFFLWISLREGFVFSYDDGLVLACERVRCLWRNEAKGWLLVGEPPSENGSSGASFWTRTRSSFWLRKDKVCLLLPSSPSLNRFFP